MNLKTKKRSLHETTAAMGGLTFLGLHRKKKDSLKRETRKRNSIVSKKDDDEHSDGSIETDISSSNDYPVRQSIAAECDSMHEGRLILETIVPIKVDVLFELLFAKKSKFLMEFHEHRQSTDVNLGGWETNKSGQNARLVSMTVILQAHIGPKTAKSKEIQTLRDCSMPGQLYSIDGIGTNEDIPYAETFRVNLHYCLMHENDKSSNLLILAKVEFVQPVWALIKTFILKHAIESLIEFFGDLQQHLLVEASKGSFTKSI